MKITLSNISKIIWILVGVLALIIVAIGLHGVIVIHNNLTELSSEITISDVRQGMAIVQSQIDNNELALEIERSLSKNPIDFTPQTWQSFLDFCEKTGYTPIDYNWQRFRYGQLKP